LRRHRNKIYSLDAAINIVALLACNMLWPISRAALALLAHSIQSDYTYLLVISNRPILFLLFLMTLLTNL